MEWRKLHYINGEEKVINPPARQLFSPSNGKGCEVTFDSFMGSLYVTCETASVFQYAPHMIPAYPPGHDLNIDTEVEVTKSSALPASIKRHG